MWLREGKIGWSKSKNGFNAKAVKWKELIDLVEDDGWYFVRQKGSYRQYKHPIKSGLITISYHKITKHVPIGTLINILKQAELNKDNK
jgi:predicted RNA binding protein YcfA (HicA-like mRNA interferase family)